MTGPSEPVDLTNCDREPIHMLGRIQQFGFLIAANLEWRITHASENIFDFTGQPVDSLLGENLSDFISDNTIHDISNRLQRLPGLQGVERVRRVEWGDKLGQFDVSLHCSEKSVVLEFEPSGIDDHLDDYIALVRRAIGFLEEAHTLSDVWSRMARYMHQLTGFSRVMVYRFLPDLSGEVVAEVRPPAAESYLGLRYPASDIPAQARRLYLYNPFRIIADVEDPGSPIIAHRDCDGTVLDLSQSALRSVSPIHIEYLRNMGVAASLSVSLIVDKKLWGLIACHHDSPMVLDQSERAASELFGQLASLVIGKKIYRDEKRLEDEASQVMSRLSVTELSRSGNIEDQIEKFVLSFCDILRADGVAVAIGGTIRCHGKTPSPEEISLLVKEMPQTESNGIFATHEMGGHFLWGQSQLQRAAGLLAISLSNISRDCVIYFRQEVVETVKWAGNPDKPVTDGPNGSRLTARKSFEVWQRTTAGQSDRWSDVDLKIAGQIHSTLLEVALRLTGEANRERDEARQKQELLISELNHRVRNILSLVKGIISQSPTENRTVEDFVQVLDSRIQALARAHDQITRTDWSTSSLKDLIAVEVESYAQERRQRVTILGDDYMLPPVAFSTVALVMHELVTNSAKYGALADQRGRVEVTLSEMDGGSLEIGWREIGGPTVKPPERRGFGSMIIERSIPFDLKGSADVQYKATGLEAKFVIPYVYVEKTKETAGSGDRGDGLVEGSLATKPNATVLVLEDNFIIGMNAETLMKNLGAGTVHLAATTDQARSIVDREPIDFALLDVNLGPETSISLAEDLHRDGIPFAFCTGYGEGVSLPPSLTEVPLIPKPYDQQSVAKVWATYVNAA